MFGYILPERAHLYLKDFDLYRNFYCGICKSMGRQFGQKTRFSINYDITFLTIVIHNFLGVDVTYDTLKCITKPFNKTKQMVAENELTDKMSAINVILCYYKLLDDCIDNKKTSRKILAKSLVKAKNKAALCVPGVEEIISKRYENLRELERANETSIDRVANEFASMMGEICDFVVGAKKQDNFTKVCYNVGKWIYLIDALDDFDDDLETKNYNLFVLNYPEIKSFGELMEKHGNEVAFSFATTINSISENYREIKFSFNQDLINNVVFRGISLMTKGIMRGEKCKQDYFKF